MVAILFRFMFFSVEVKTKFYLDVCRQKHCVERESFINIIFTRTGVSMLGGNSVPDSGISCNIHFMYVAIKQNLH